MDFICGFINEISDEMQACGKRIIAWGDMFLYRYESYNKKNQYACNAASPEIEQYLLEHLSRDVIIADWQYDAIEAPVETAAVFKQAGFDCLLCPWDCGVSQTKAVIRTVKDTELMGYIHTTWHTLSAGMPFVAFCALGGFECIDDYKIRPLRTQTATLMRKVMPINGDYRKAGWSRFEVDCKW